MKLEQNRIDDLNLELTLSVGKEDYAENKKKRLNDFRKKAEIKGFRKGMVPVSLVEKMYGQSALVDAVNDVISENLNGFIRDNGLKVLGEPLPSENQPQAEWVDGNDFTFKFDVALNPEISFELSKDDEIPYYTITVTEAAKKEMKENLLRQYGSLEEGKAAKEEDFIIVDFEQGETKVEGTYVALRNVAEAVRKSFVGVKPGDVLDVNVNEAFENETDRASMLKVNKDELATLDPMFKMTVKNVKTFVNAPLTEETFEKVFGVKTEEEFNARIEDRIRAEYVQEADFRFSKDARNFLVEKADVKVAEKFLKRWIHVINEGKFTMEDIEKEWDLFIADYKWQMVRSYLMEKYGVKVEEADLLASAKGFAAYQFAMYGMNNVPDEQLESFAKNILSQEEQGRRILDQVENEKTVAAVREVVSLKKKKISVDKFRELK
ncbi:MAG: trigger factor [Bacteroidales bacterium]|nr:trigger factor [Bacteroidales bacterium]MBQ6689952.1 trigger factor [Bacteroidales bacterium]